MTSVCVSDMKTEVFYRNWQAKHGSGSTYQMFSEVTSYLVFICIGLYNVVLSVHSCITRGFVFCPTQPIPHALN